MLLPARGFHDGRDRCALRLSQHAKDGFLFGAATGWARNTLKLCRSFGASLAALPARFYCVFCCATFEIPFGCDGIGAVTTEAPQWQQGQRGGIRIEPKALFSLRTLTLYCQRQSSPFW